MKTNNIDASETPLPLGLTRNETIDVAEAIAYKLEFDPTNEKSLENVLMILGGEIIEVNNRLPLKAEIEIHGEGDFKIFINPNAIEINRFTIAHEIAHYLLHSQMGKISMTEEKYGYGIIETEANWFASGFLMPGCMLRKYIKENKKASLEEIASHFNVSVQALKVRLLGLYD